MASLDSVNPTLSPWGKVARVLAVAAPMVALVNAIISIRVGAISGASLLDSGPNLQWTLVSIAAVCAVGMAYLIRRMIGGQTGPTELFSLLGLAALPWIAGLLGIWLSGTRTLTDTASAGLTGYAGMVARQAQGTLLGWSLLGSVTFALVIVTFIRRTPPVREGDALPVALAVLPSVIFAILAVRGQDLGFFAASVVGNPISALLLLPFAGAATRRAPADATALPGLGAALGFALAFAAALSAAYGVGIQRMLFAVYSTSGVGVEAVEAGLAELGTMRGLPVWGFLIAVLPAVVIAAQLRVRGRAIQPALAAAIPVLLVALGLQMLVTSKTQGALAMLASARPAEAVPTPTLQTVDSVPATPPVEIRADSAASPTGIPGGVIGGEIGPPASAVRPPEVISQYQPAYPDIARQARVGGIVVVQVEIDTAGAVTTTTILRPVNPSLDSAAVQALRRWRYRPAMQDGRPVVGKRVETLNFVPPERN